jgi:hypothetical protein
MATELHPRFKRHDFSLLGCGGVFQGVSIFAMSSEFDRNRPDPDPSPPIWVPEGQVESDSLDAREPTLIPPGLMRKRRHPIVWIGLALLLGGLIALVLAALVTD